MWQTRSSVWLKNYNGQWNKQGSKKYFEILQRKRFFKSDVNTYDSHPLTYIDNSTLQSFSQYYNLASHTTYVVCVYLIHKCWWTYSFMSTPKADFKFVYCQNFWQKFAEEVIKGIIFQNFAFCWRCLTWCLIRGLTLN